MNTSSLRSRLLSLAIHGKLVPQDPNDESSAELLKKICPDADVVTEGVPEGWCLAKMQQLCWMEDGEKEEGIERKNLDVKFLRGAKEPTMMTSGRYTPAGSLLILVDGENSGEIFKTTIEGYQGSTFKQLCISQEMDENYMLNVINFHRKMLRENKVGFAIPHLNKKLFKAIDVPVPPLAEQHRIVSKIEEIFSELERIEGSL